MKLIFFVDKQEMDVSLQIIFEKLNDIEEVLRFCHEKSGQSLWTIPIEESIDKSDFIRELLNHAGGDIK
ncbi:unnamed protein product [Rotaria magnacalcarata]|uniref:Uncharacterized protein n=1 Tax=Rotaria magnacalcarata TaxID=392030 RepID=A0A819HQP1_9BILA|nr:unnamed protein product [Rotaria magnacalcarata]CAF3906101.1 unnamed protein product [Rotaria magnacalcarata]CAF3981220.1 unnamed protein product [Rotaria magnacalcarata]CAF4013232.1 unnamed protein product [Rotaria magnacalcarata]CAF4015742.1 unnamed protein product [Rotaria magnacalcarata]